jgi:hypothetical protein
MGPPGLGSVAALGFLPCILAFASLKDERTLYSIFVSAIVSALGFLATRAVIPLIKARTLKAGLRGKDINKKGSEAGEKDIPESLGLAPGVVFLVRFAGLNRQQHTSTLQISQKQTQAKTRNTNNANNAYNQYFQNVGLHRSFPATPCL